MFGDNFMSGFDLPSGFGLGDPTLTFGLEDPTLTIATDPLF
jgi:hypothetical protein